MQIKITQHSRCNNIHNLNITIKEGYFSTRLYDKSDAYNFYIVRLPYKYCNILFKVANSMIKSLKELHN